MAAAAAARQRLGEDSATEVYASQLALPKNDMYINPVGSMRRDAFSDDGSVPGSDPAVVVRQLLDSCGVDHALPMRGNIFGLGALMTPTRRPRSLAPSTAGSVRSGSITIRACTRRWWQRHRVRSSQPRRSTHG